MYSIIVFSLPRALFPNVLAPGINTNDTRIFSPFDSHVQRPWLTPARAKRVLFVRWACLVQTTKANSNPWHGQLRPVLRFSITIIIPIIINTSRSGENHVGIYRQDRSIGGFLRVPNAVGFQRIFFDLTHGGSYEDLRVCCFVAMRRGINERGWIA